MAKKLCICPYKRKAASISEIPNVSLSIAHDDRFQRLYDEHLLEDGMNSTIVKKAPIVTESEVCGNITHKGKGHKNGQLPIHAQLVKPDAIHATNSLHVSSTQYES